MFVAAAADKVYACAQSLMLLLAAVAIGTSTCKMHSTNVFQVLVALRMPLGAVQNTHALQLCKQHAMKIATAQYYVIHYDQ
jgi:hypothetical protein